MKLEGSRTWLRLFSVLLLTLGIGFGSVVFAILNAVFFRAVPVPDAERVVLVSGAATPPDRDILDWWGQSQSISPMATFSVGGVSLSTGGNPDRCSAALVSSDFFAVLKLTPLVGRTFDRMDEEAGAIRTVVISTQFAVRQFGDKAALGQEIAIDAVPHMVVGVMGVADRFPPDIDLWIPRTRGRSSVSLGVTPGDTPAESFRG